MPLNKETETETRAPLYALYLMASVITSKYS